MHPCPFEVNFGLLKIYFLITLSCPFFSAKNPGIFKKMAGPITNRLGARFPPNSNRLE
jgi:hypothetical protein